MNGKALLKMSDADKELLFFVIAEQTEQFVFPEISRHAGKRIGQFFVVLDLKGINVLSTYFKMKPVFKITNQVLSDFYPETLYKMYIINAGNCFVSSTNWLRTLLFFHIRNDEKMDGQVDCRKDFHRQR